MTIAMVRDARDAITEGVATRADIARHETKIDTGLAGTSRLLGFPAALAAHLFGAFQAALDTAARFPREQGPVAGAGLEPATQGL